MVSEVSVCAAPRSSPQHHVLPSVCHLQELSYCLLTCTYGLSYADSLVQLQSKLTNRGLLRAFGCACHQSALCLFFAVSYPGC